MTATQDRPVGEVDKEIGRDRRRKEDQRLITGRTRWTDNITLPGMLHLAMVRSPHAHAKILSIDTAEAKTATNVVDVVTGADLGEGFSFRRSTLCMIIPGVQNPHCSPWHSRNASCTGCS